MDNGSSPTDRLAGWPGPASEALLRMNDRIRYAASHCDECGGELSAAEIADEQDYCRDCGLYEASLDEIGGAVDEASGMVYSDAGPGL